MSRLFRHHRVVGKLERWLRVSDVRSMQGVVRQRLGSHGTRAGGAHDERLPVGHQRPGGGVAGWHGIGKRIDGKLHVYCHTILIVVIFLV